MTRISEQRELSRRVTYLEARLHIKSPTALLAVRPHNEASSVYAAIRDNRMDARIIGNGFTGEG